MIKFSGLFTASYHKISGSGYYVCSWTSEGELLGVYPFWQKTFEHQVSNNSDVLGCLIVNISRDRDPGQIYIEFLRGTRVHRCPCPARVPTSGLGEREAVQRRVLYPAQAVLTIAVVARIGGAEEAAVRPGLLWRQAGLVMWSLNILCLNRFLQQRAAPRHVLLHARLHFAESVAGVEADAEHLHDHTVVVDHWGRTEDGKIHHNTPFLKHFYNNHFWNKSPQI